MKKKRRTIELAQQTAEMFARCVAVLKPPPELTLSQWADTYRMLSAENSATPGRWHTDNAPYQREIMDAIGDQHVRKVVVMSAAQIGKTAMLMNMLGYYMHYYPAPVLVMQPTLEMGQTFSKDFLAPMIRDTPVLRVLVDTKSRYSGKPCQPTDQGAAVRRGGPLPGQRRNRGRPAAPGAEATNDLLGQEDRYRIDTDHQGKQPHRDGVPGDDAGGMERTVPEVRALSAPSLGQHRIRPARPEKGRAPQVRALRARKQ